MKTTKARRSSFLRSVAAAIVATSAIAALVTTSAAATTLRGAADATVVWISAPKAAPKPVQAVMTNQERSFIPPLLVVPVGSTVRFPNDDPFYHSIYSTSAADPFDIGFYDTGPGKVVQFAHPGIDDLHCHIHVSMHATIVVADGPFDVTTDGRYELDGVPPGRYVLHAWDLRHGERITDVDVPDRGTVTLDIRR